MQSMSTMRQPRPQVAQSTRQGARMPARLPRLVVAHGTPAQTTTLSANGVGAIIDPSDKQKLDVLVERFKMADVDGNGRIDREELRALLESTEQGTAYLFTEHWLPEAELEKVMKTYDTDGSGDISFDEFKQLIYDGILLDGKFSEYEDAFNAVDSSGNGTIGATELAKLFAELGQPLSMEKLVDIMQQYDKDESGQIDFREFLLMFRDKLLDLQTIRNYFIAQAQKNGGGSVQHSQAVIDVVEGDLSLIFSEAELDEILTKNKDKLTVLFCALTWCRPCKAMQKPILKMAEAYKTVTFVKLFGNANVQTKTLFKDRLKIRSTPCFVVFKGGEVVFSMTGGNKSKLEGALRDFLPANEQPSEELYPLVNSQSSMDGPVPDN